MPLSIGWLAERPGCRGHGQVVAVCTVARHEGSGSGAGAAADVGGVGGPVSGGCALPGGGDGDVDAELAEAFGQAAGADRTSGLSAWEQPGRGAVIADGRVAAPGGEELPDEAGGGSGRVTGSRPRLSWTCSLPAWTWPRRLMTDGRWA
jgi:hypothetical protein